MRKRFFILLSSILLSSCTLLDIPASNTNTSYKTSITSSQEENSTSSQDYLTHYRLEAYYDYEINSELGGSSTIPPNTPSLLFDYNGPNTLSVNLKKYGIKNIIGGDAITFTSKQYGLYINTTYPGVIMIPNDVTKIELIETPVYEFEVQRNDMNEQYLYCIYKNKSYPMTNRIIKNHESLLLVEENEIYDTMKLYGTFNKNNEIDTMFTYNPRLDNSQKEEFEIQNNNTYEFIEQEGSIGTFINNKHIVKTNIKEFNNLVIGNDYIIQTKSSSLVVNSKEIEYLITPFNIELSGTLNKSDDTIDIKIYCIVDSYDGMPRYDEETGESDFSYRFWYSRYEYCYFNLSEPMSFIELCETSTLESSLYTTCQNINIYSSYRGFDIFDDEDKENYELVKNQKISEDTIIFIGQSSDITYM